MDRVTKPVWLKSDEIPKECKDVGLGKCQMAYEEYVSKLPESYRPKTIAEDNVLRGAFLAGVKHSKWY